MSQAPRTRTRVSTSVTGTSVAAMIDHIDAWAVIIWHGRCRPSSPSGTPPTRPRASRRCSNATAPRHWPTCDGIRVHGGCPWTNPGSIDQPCRWPMSTCPRSAGGAGHSPTRPTGSGPTPRFAGTPITWPARSSRRPRTVARARRDTAGRRHVRRGAMALPPAPGRRRAGRPGAARRLGGRRKPAGWADWPVGVASGPCCSASPSLAMNASREARRRSSSYEIPVTAARPPRG